jgi:cyclophilin family peptidyl-prolyl cis-trans isomerase
MAREQNPNSARSQFYINIADNSSLDFKGPQRGWGYTVFGRVREGMDVADAISMVETGVARGMPDVPLEPVVILSATLVKD